jgi:hypothetical protein
MAAACLRVPPFLDRVSRRYTSAPSVMDQKNLLQIGVEHPYRYREKLI